MSSLRCLAFVSLLAVVACRDPTPTRPAAYDSAGVAVIATPASALEAAPVWRLADTPALQVGTAEGTPASQFHQVAGVLRLPDGRIVVADRGSSEIRFFDATGRHLSSQGRAGDAPGEYRLITDLGFGPGDSLWVYDFGLRRFTVLATSGTVARTVSVGPVLSAVTAVGRLASGAFVVREQWSSATHDGARAGLVRAPAAVARIPGDRHTIDTITLAGGREVFIGSEGGRGVMSAPLFARQGIAALHDSLVFVGDQAAYEIRAYRADGLLRRIIRLSGVDLTIGREAVRLATEARLAGQPEEHQAAMRSQLAAMAVPPSRPAYGALLADDDGNLWVGSFELRGPSRSWVVFGPRGMLQATISVPDRFRLHQVVGGLAVGVWADSLGIEYVRLYPVER